MTEYPGRAEVEINSVAVTVFTGSRIAGFPDGSVMVMPPRLDMRDRPRGASTVARLYGRDGGITEFPLTAQP